MLSLEWTVSLAEAVGSTYNVGDTFCFNYSEQDWLTRSWSSVKDSVLANSTLSVNCATGQ